MATAPSALPPTTIRSSTPISQSAAHDFLAAYLDRANTDPALQPNAGISEHGPVSRTTAAAPNLILHNLKRVQAGLAGEVLGRDLSVIGDEGTVQPPGAAESGDWQDAKQFEQQANGDEQQQDTMEIDAVQQELNEDDAAGGLDKEERKRKKKERRLAEKKAKANNAA